MCRAYLKMFSYCIHFCFYANGDLTHLYFPLYFPSKGNLWKIKWAWVSSRGLHSSHIPQQVIMVSYINSCDQCIKQMWGWCHRLFPSPPQVSWFLWRAKDSSSSPFNRETPLAVHFLPYQLPAETEPDWKYGDSHWIFSEWLNRLCV